MKINEVEALAGITKKNIRFYEEQGLLSPKRDAGNGYREYGEAELAALRRIKLLRKLGVPIGEIRLLLEGGQTVGDVMRRHLVHLEREQRNLEQAAALCRELQSFDAPTSELDAEAMLARMETLERGGAVFYVDIAFNPGNSLDTLLRIGKDAPLHSTSSGKLLLSAHTDAAVERIITEKGLPKLTANTITNKKDLRKELAKIRENGYAIDNEECEEGHKCLSVPIRDYTGQICGAISAFDHSDVMSEERMLTELLPACRKTAGEISARLGYSGSLSS